VSDQSAPQQTLSFLDLGERLRQRGQFEAALSVAQAGAARYPTLAAAHDLIGRIMADQGDDEGARSAWLATLECDATHPGALKGLAFLAFRRRDFGDAERYLEAAAAASPRDTSTLTALDRVRSMRPANAPEVINIEDPVAGLLLLDNQGLRLAGGLGTGRAEQMADAAAATAAGAAREAERTARLLGLGAWQHLLIEGDSMRITLLPATAQAMLLVRRPATAPVGRLLAFAARAVQAARAWLGSS
jgi:predicted regulator of Ras-like GTPase activity (Roadblock/LC7/MglB family)